MVGCDRRWPHHRRPQAFIQPRSSWPPQAAPLSNQARFGWLTSVGRDRRCKTIAIGWGRRCFSRLGGGLIQLRLPSPGSPQRILDRLRHRAQFGAVGVGLDQVNNAPEDFPLRRIEIAWRPLLHADEDVARQQPVSDCCQLAGIFDSQAPQDRFPCCSQTSSCSEILLPRPDRPTLLRKPRRVSPPWKRSAKTTPPSSLIKSARSEQTNRLRRLFVTTRHASVKQSRHALETIPA